jgi:diguanylate cyclase (GGDEF)-like protein/PAS domain S-box-containing protein
LCRTLVDSLTDHAVFAISPGGEVVSWNAGAEKAFGYSLAEIIGQPFDVFFTAEDVQSCAPQQELTSALSGKTSRHDRWHVRKNGTRFWGTNTVSPLRGPDGVLRGFTKVVHDTTDSHLAIQKVSESEQQLRLLIEGVRDYAIFSIESGGKVNSWNPGGQKLFGYAAADIVGSDFSVLFSPDDISAGVPIAQLRKVTMDGSANLERWLVRKDGSRFLASGKLSPLVHDGGQARGFVYVVHDITANHAAAEDLRRQAKYDELTGLANRRTFNEHLQRAIALLKRRPSILFAALFIDIDHFKSMNDVFGHIFADRLLEAVAHRLEKCVRSEDIVARTGGDEFAILLNGITGVADANDAAERIGAEMRQPIRIDGRDALATVSIGIAMSGPQYQHPEDILQDADSAMYVAKSGGRARAVVFDPAMAPGARIKSDLAEDLRQAIERGELRVAYQPIMRLRDTTIVGFEALVRWQHPERGLLHPERFIPIAEQSDLIINIDEWMLRKACRQLAHWQARGVGPGLQMSINISSKEFAHDDFLANLRLILESTGLAPACLRLEITESAIMEQSQRVDALLSAIRELGVSIDIDDFGTGYSSLETLQHMTVDALKIDPTFIGIMNSHKGRGLVETVIFLARKLGLSTVSEGIESIDQLRALDGLACEFGQGHLFAPPLDADAAGRFITEGKFATLLGVLRTSVVRQRDRKGI